ncbi:hypothetical protein F2Q70_00016093 [Brassica cretica]|uniref:Uncharacterized protein n=1 Tax=Brassica cretica TaxID=69181 RepID=A0A8S9I1L6_BRACR|nr:hypothetical protein F2Q70_00016093 [Brassica cretica]
MNRLKNSWLALSRSLDSISHGHSLALLTRRRTISRSRSDLSLLAELTCRSVVTRTTSRHSTDESSLDRRVVTRPTSRHSTVLSSLDRFVVTRSMSRHSTDESSLDRFVITRPFCPHSAQSILSPRSAQSLGSISRGHSTCSSQSLDSQSLRLLASLEHDVIPRRHVHPLSIDSSSMTTCSGGSEYCPHRSFAQPSRSKKSDRNQKYVDDNSPETLARALAVTRLDLSRSLTRSPYSAQNDLSQSLRSFPPRGVDVSFCRHPIDESSLDRRVFTRPTSRHSTVLSSLDR